MPTRVLIAENRENLATRLAATLQDQGYEVVTALDGVGALRSIRVARPDIVIVDRTLPHVGGLRICRHIRKEPRTAETPIIMVSTNGNDRERSRAFDAGVDVYLTEPVDMNELLARVSSVQRRNIGEESAELLVSGPIQMDVERWLAVVSGVQVDLTVKEFNLLRALIEARGRVLSRDALLERIWGIGNGRAYNSRTVDVHIGRLRRKLRHAGSMILTIRNVGYRMDISREWITRSSRS